MLHILDKRWESDGALDSHAPKFLESAELPFPIQSLADLVHVGTDLVRQQKDVRFGARHVQGGEMGKMTRQASNDKPFVMGRPGFGGEIAQLHGIGQMQRYEGDSPGQPRIAGLPYDDS